VKRLLGRLLWRLVPPEPFMVFEEIARYGDEIVSMCSHRGDLFIATRRGTLYQVKEIYL
jgi:hypothetical protein